MLAVGTKHVQGRGGERGCREPGTEEGLSERGQGTRPWGLQVEPVLGGELGEPPRGPGEGDADAGRGAGGEMGFDPQNPPRGGWAIQQAGVLAWVLVQPPRRGGWQFRRAHT